MTKNVFKIPFSSSENIIADKLWNWKINILLLHWWWSKSNKERFNIFRHNLLESGITTVAFDHIWHGESSWTLTWSTLKSRTKQTLCVAKYFNLDSSTTILWTSMGAYTAIIAGTILNFKKIILFVPGVYTNQAYEIPFWPLFSKIIREDRSWETSDVFNKISSFSKWVLIFWAIKDDVIPEEIPNILFDLSQIKNKELLWINSTHNIQEFLQNSPPIRQLVVNKVRWFLNS